MSLATARKGWIGVGLQTGFQVPAVISDYVYLTQNTLHGVTEQMKVSQAMGVRDTLFSTVSGKQFSEGDQELLVDKQLAGYFLVGAMGTVAAAGQGSGVFQHTISRNNSNTPQYLTIVEDRVVDRQYYPDVAVDQLDFEVATDLAHVKAKLIGNFPVTTTSGTLTTTSGNVLSFKNSAFAFGATVAAAQAATNLKPHDFKLSIKNNAEAVFAHGQATPRSINFKDFEVTADMTLYFENTTDRDAFYNQTKQAACLQLTGQGIGGGFNEFLRVNLYQTSVTTFDLETGLSNFYAEKVALACEYDNANQKTIDMVLQNTKTLYI